MVFLFSLSHKFEYRKQFKKSNREVITSLSPVPSSEQGSVGCNFYLEEREATFFINLSLVEHRGDQASTAECMMRVR